MNIDVNWAGIIFAGVASMVVGFLWYSPLLFAKPWMKLMGYTKESMAKAQKEMGNMYFISFLFTLLMAYVLYHVMVMSQNFFAYEPWMTGLTTAFFMWLGFIAPVQVTGVIFGKGNPKENWKLFYINTGYQLVSMLLMGSILAIYLK